ncbi:OmpA/MotB family protein [Dokdonia donghaensis]|uniref:Cell envelope biogenesis protein OmpA n=1 Tax=Dokdonia donghaensis DSW-1 TaxID=1300343 RepID=A0A0A2GW31_9FLAO|nr:OmpA family protein [Dokdonia donghaensis]ANH59344.1 putative lipoprotein YiaD precursor [Dokdonia donghaensis DSW-1]KGO06743.1 cell envelope biogenesis protein OmpA [Dokdonia donghaensis DSW-1]
MKKILICLLALSALVSCVPAKKFKDLEAKYSRLRKDNRNMSKELSEAKAALEKTKEERDLALVDLDALSNKYNEVSGEYDAAKANLAQLQDSYNALETNSSASIAENSKKNRQLLAELESKQNDLAEKTAALEAERKRLERLQKDLADRSARVDELEGLIAAKDAKMRGLKDAISKALTDFEGKGLTVEQRDGKVYVSLENKLLFDSGSWTVGTNGTKAVKQLGSVLADNPEIAVLIEGHTDNVPYGGSGNLQGNWDLSAKRATSIVNILRQNKRIDPKNLTAAGRGEYAPVAENDTPENKAKNRRIEVILTPKLDEVKALLQEID